MVLDRQTDGVRRGEEGGEGRFTFAVNIIRSDQSERTRRGAFSSSKVRTTAFVNSRR